MTPRCSRRSVGDCYDNALAESFVDSYKTELIADRVWRITAQLELATVDYLAASIEHRRRSRTPYAPPRRHPVAGRGGFADLQHLSDLRSA